MGASAPIPAATSRERLVASHMPLVHSIARRHVGKGEELEDLVQVGALGLLKASDRFDPGRGVAFATFAAPVIEGEIRHHLRDRTAPIRIPRELEQLRIRIRRERAELQSTLGRPPSTAELARALDVEESDIERALVAEQARDSISITSDEADVPTAADSGAPASSDDRLALEKSMRSLDDRERRIVFLRFQADMTEKQIAQELGLSQAHVSRLLKGALATMRSELATPEDTAQAGNTTSDPDRAGPPPIAAGTRISHVGRASTAAKTEKLTLADYLALPYDPEINVERGGERTRWKASVEELSGCVAEGDTPDQALARLRPAMESWFRSAIAEHREIPLPGKKQAGSRAADSYSGRFLVRMPKPLHAELASAAEREQVSLNRYVTDVLSAAVQQGGADRASNAAPAEDPALVAASTQDAGAEGTDTQPAAPRSIRLVLATNMVVVVFAGVVALVLLVIALQRGV
jgi:RNA polymerase sigma-B factor